MRWDDVLEEFKFLDALEKEIPKEIGYSDSFHVLSPKEIFSQEEGSYAINTNHPLSIHILSLKPEYLEKFIKEVLGSSDSEQIYHYAYLLRMYLLLWYFGWGSQYLPQARLIFINYLAKRGITGEKLKRILDLASNSVILPEYYVELT